MQVERLHIKSRPQDSDVDCLAIDSVESLLQVE